MKDTACGKNCAFVKSGFCESDKECPHFVQTIWQKNDDPTPVIVSDCFPKKFALEQNKLLHKFLDLQKLMEENRNHIAKLEGVISQLVDIFIKKEVKEQNKYLILDDKESIKSLE